MKPPKRTAAFMDESNTLTKEQIDKITLNSANRKLLIFTGDPKTLTKKDFCTNASARRK